MLTIFLYFKITPLYIACLNGNTEVVRLLLQVKSIDIMQKAVSIIVNDVFSLVIIKAHLLLLVNLVTLKLLS